MKLMAIDGNSIINRAYFGIQRLTAGDGTPTNAVYGFLTILQKLIKEESPDAIYVMFDLREKTFRHHRYEKYKANRTGMPDELAVQMPIVKEVLEAMKIPRSQAAGWEADDLLGTAARICEESDCECVIVSGDKDALQLVSDKTRVKHVKTRQGRTETRDYTPAVFIEEYGFVPQRLVDLKALMGDASDNIPGVKGVGEKTAMDLIQRFGSIDGIYSSLDSLDIKESVRKKLIAGEEDARLSYDLALIRRDAPAEILPNNKFSFGDIDNERLSTIFKRLGFVKLLDTFGLPEPKMSEPAFDIIRVKTAAEGDKLSEHAQNADCVTFVPDDSFYSAALADGKSVYLLSREDTVNYDDLLRLLLSSAVRKAGHNIKDTMRICLERGIETDNWLFDTALAAYLISPTDNSYDISKIASRYCGFTLPAAASNSIQMSLLDESKPQISPPSIAAEAFAVGLLRDIFAPKLRELNLERVFFDIDLPLCRTLAEMEFVGFAVDKPALIRYGETLAAGITETESSIFALAGEQFNINSPKQLGTILFDKLMLPAPKKTKTGYSTSVDVLDSLIDKHPVISYVKDYRELTKLKSTYADGLLKVVRNNGRIHTRFQMTVTATGRLSSIEPNLQNIPIRKAAGSELRRMFIAGDGNVLVGADYSQIELRLLAHIAGDPVMRAAFDNGEDIHTVTASQVFGVPIGEVTSLMRSRAKAVNFGIVYGISPFSLARDIGVSSPDAKMYIDNYLNKYSGVNRYMHDIVEKAKADGFVTTIYGRLRSIPELKSKKHSERAFGERVALNMPIQGTAADIIKIAMINVSKRLKKEKPAAKLVLQIHDELIVECPENDAESVSRILCEEMENSAQLSVPLIAEAHCGKSWYDAK